MNSKKSIIVSILIVILNIAIGHFFAPNGILFTPIVFIAIAIIIWFSNNNLTLLQKSMFLAGLVSLHDIGIKLFAGGRHDAEGKGFTHLMFLMGLIPVIIILISGIVSDKNEIKRNKYIAFLLFIIMIVIHLFLFEDLGMGRYYWYDWNG